MPRLLVHVEGETEETFVNTVLRPYLLDRGFESVAARLYGNARQRDRRGGGRPWSAVRTEIVNHLLRDTGCHSTTMVDYYGMPSVGNKAWPGRQGANALPYGQRAAAVEAAMLNDVRVASQDRVHARFVPFVIIHEFEGLLFSDCNAFGRGIGMPQVVGQLQTVRDQFQNPEQINDSPVTAPSKRIATIVRGYEKVIYGTIAAIEIGLDTMRRECPHLADWLARLEAVV